MGLFELKNLTNSLAVDILNLILGEMLDPRLLGKIFSDRRFFILRKRRMKKWLQLVGLATIIQGMLIF